jgi:rubrerythrin
MMTAASAADLAGRDAVAPGGNLRPAFPRDGGGEGVTMSQPLSLEAAIHEALVKPLMNVVEKVRRALSEPAGEDLLTTLQQNYQAERRLARQLRAQASLMPNELFRDTLEQIAAETQHQAQLLAGQLDALGGAPLADSDQETAEAQPASTIWRLLETDITAIDRLSSRYRDQLGWITAPPVRDLLQHLRLAKHRHRQRLSDLLARIDSYARPERDHRARP